MEMWTEWWEIAKSGSPVAIFVMGVAGIFLWRAYQGELKYSKDRDNQTLTALMNLTNVMEGVEKQESELLRQQAESANALTGMVASSSKELLTTMQTLIALMKEHGHTNETAFNALKAQLEKLQINKP